jgi:hypothetical protein
MIEYSAIEAIQAHIAGERATREVLDTLEMFELQDALKASVDAYLNPNNVQEVR